MKLHSTLHEAITEVGRSLRSRGSIVPVERWQGVEAPAPTLELFGASFRAPIPPGIDELRRLVKPNLPWADDHFAERVGGEPTNPGEAYKTWPFHRKSPEEFHDNEVFTHTYQERLWSPDIPGLRYPTGCLQDVINLLREDPTTRQAFVPIWWPEDTGARHGGRIPCTIGWWFVRRMNHLHMTYWIRSCDYMRHFRDDIYMAARLNQWIIETVGWKRVEPGFLDFHCGSMHCWASEKPMLPTTVVGRVSR